MSIHVGDRRHARQRYRRRGSALQASLCRQEQELLGDDSRTCQGKGRAVFGASFVHHRARAKVDTEFSGVNIHPQEHI